MRPDDHRPRAIEMLLAVGAGTVTFIRLVFSQAPTFALRVLSDIPWPGSERPTTQTRRRSDNRSGSVPYSRSGAGRFAGTAVCWEH